MMSGRRAIITGTNGFIGGSLRNKLQSDFEIIEINEDIFDKSDWQKSLKDIISDVDAFFHVGACSNTLEDDVNYMMSRNFESTKIISDTCVEKGIKLIYSSSAAVYGVDGKIPSNLYAWSKWVSECYVVKNKGIALRYFNVYGPGESHKGRMSSVAYQMYMKNKNGEVINLFPLKPKRDFVYIGDVIDANIHAYNSNISGYFDVGSGDARTFEDVLDILDIKYGYTLSDDIPNGYQFFTESDRNKWMPGWNPKYNIELGLSSYKRYLDTL